MLDVHVTRNGVEVQVLWTAPCIWQFQFCCCRRCSAISSMTNINLLPNGQVARSLLSHLRDVAERSLAPLSYCKENATNFWGEIPLKLLCLGPHRTARRKS
jgi:hypothetical protein